MSAYESDYDRVVALCTSPPASGKPIFYQKHMTHHMLPGFDRRWVLQLSNAFLIRDPVAVLSSYARKWEEVSLRAIGIVEQWQLFDLVAQALGRAPPVIDAEDVLRLRAKRWQAVRGSRPGFFRCDAVLAAGAQTFRWSVGAPLVQRRSCLDRLRTFPSASSGRPAGGASQDCR